MANVNASKPVKERNGDVVDLQTEDIKAQFDLITDFVTLSSKIGPEKTQEELIPLLEAKNLVDKEILLELTEKLPSFLPVIGGSDCFHHILRILDILINSGDIEVKEKAIERFKSFFKKLNAANVEDHVIPYLQKLSADSWASTRALSCKLYCVCYPRVSDILKNQLLSNFRTLCQDEIGSVRCAAVAEFGELAKLVAFQRMETEIIPVFESLSKDSKELVRISVVDAFFGISTKLIPRNVEQLLMPAMRKLFKDHSFEVRCKVAERIIDLQKAVGTGITKTDLVPAFADFLKDSTPEVRLLTLHNIIDFCRHLNKDICDNFLHTNVLPELKHLVSDTCPQVRVAASVIPQLAQFLTFESITEHLLPPISRLITDSSIKVSRTTICKLDLLKKAIGVKAISEVLIPEIIKSMNDPKLCNRLIAIENLPFLSEKLGSEFFNQQLTALCVSQTSDKCFIFRESAFRNFEMLIKILGSEWVKSTVIPEIKEMCESQDSAMHERSLSLIKVLIETCGITDLCEYLSPAMLHLADGEKTAIRHSLAKTLHDIAVRESEMSEPQRTILDCIKPVVVTLSQDSNPVVSQFSMKTLNAFFSPQE